MNKHSKTINKFLFDELVKGNNVFYYKKEEKIYLSDSYFIGVIPEDEFILNPDKIKNVDLVHFIETLNIEDYRKVKTWYGKEQYIYLLDDNDYKITCQKKYFKLFKDYDLYIWQDIKPILCLDGEEVVGLILPVKVY